MRFIVYIYLYCTIGKRQRTLLTKHTAELSFVVMFNIGGLFAACLYDTIFSRKNIRIKNIGLTIQITYSPCYSIEKLFSLETNTIRGNCWEKHRQPVYIFSFHSSFEIFSSQKRCIDISLPSYGLADPNSLSEFSPSKYIDKQLVFNGNSSYYTLERRSALRLRFSISSTRCCLCFRLFALSSFLFSFFFFSFLLRQLVFILGITLRDAIFVTQDAGYAGGDKLMARRRFVRRPGGTQNDTP